MPDASDIEGATMSMMVRKRKPVGGPMEAEDIRMNK